MTLSTITNSTPNRAATAKKMSDKPNGVFLSPLPFELWQLSASKLEITFRILAISISSTINIDTITPFWAKDKIIV